MVGKTVAMSFYVDQRTLCYVSAKEHAYPTPICESSYLYTNGGGVGFANSQMCPE